METEKFAEVVWVAGDVTSLRPEMTEEQANDFLAENESCIQDQMIERGWAAIGDLLQDWDEENKI